MNQEKSKLLRDVEIQANHEEGQVFSRAWLCRTWSGKFRPSTLPSFKPPPPSPSPAIRLELHFREPVLCIMERNLCSLWAHIVTCLSCSLFFLSFTELKGGRKRRPSENKRNVFCCLLQPWWLKGFLSVCSNKYPFLLVFGTALLCRSSNGWLLVFHSGIRKWQYITSS